MKYPWNTSLVLAFLISIIGCGPKNDTDNQLKALTRTPEYSVKFVTADLKEDGEPKTEVINGVSRLVFRDLTPEDQQTYASVIQRVMSSEVIKKALELRWDARSYKAILSGGKLGVEDSPADPFYIVLRWNENTLEAKADPAVIYSADTGPKFSSVSLIVTGLGPVPFEKLTDVPFISDAIVMHELMHCVQIEATGSEQFNAAMMASTSMSALAHKIHRLTDQPRAFVEGFAEGFERIGGRLVGVDFQSIYDDFVAAGPRNLTQEQFEFLRDKILAEELRRQSWIRDDYFGGFDELGSTLAFLHHPRDILNSEGVVATAMYNFLMNSDITSVYPKMITTIIKHQPATLAEFFTAFGQEFPDDRIAASSVFLRQTLSVTRNPSTFELFTRWRQEVAMSTTTSASAEQAKQFYSDALDTELQLLPYDAVLNSLLNHPLKINTKNLGKHYPPFSIDLNQDSDLVLTMVFKDMVSHYESIGMASAVKGFKGVEEAQTAAIITRRETLHNLTSLNDLDGVIDAGLLNILRANLIR